MIPYGILLWTGLCSSAVFGQSENIQAVLEPVLEGDTLFLQAYANNLAEGTVAGLCYELLVSRRDRRGNRADSEKSGQFRLLSNQQQLLAKEVIHLGAYLEVSVQLKVFNIRGVLVGEDEANFSAPQREVDRATIAQNPTDQTTTFNANDIEISGVFVLDNTRTRAGHDFYDLFFQRVGQLQIPGSFQFLIEEQPARGMMTVITIELNGYLIFQNPLPPRYDQVEQLAAYASQAAINYLQYYEEFQRNLEGENFEEY